MNDDTERPRRIDLNLFRVFEAIYQEGSLTRAGEVLHMSQPAVSNALARLRAAYDDALFVRQGRGMSPTPLGETIASDVRDGLRRLWSSLDDRTPFDAARSARRFRISAGDLLATMGLAPLLPQLARTDITVEVQAFNRRGVVHELAAGRIDLALDAVPTGDNQFDAQRILQEEFVCALRAGHPALARQLTLERYLALTHVHASGRRKGIGQVDLALRRLGLNRRIAVRTPHHLGLPHLVQSTDLVATIPRSLAAAHQLQVLDLPFELPPLEIHAIWHRHAGADTASQWFREALIASHLGGQGTA